MTQRRVTVFYFFFFKRWPRLFLKGGECDNSTPTSCWRKISLGPPKRDVNSRTLLQSPCSLTERADTSATPTHLHRGRSLKALGVTPIHYQTHADISNTQETHCKHVDNITPILEPYIFLNTCKVYCCAQFVKLLDTHYTLYNLQCCSLYNAFLCN